MNNDQNKCVTRRDFIKASAAIGASGLLGGCMSAASNPSPSAGAADTILLNGRIATQDERRSMVSALAIKDGRVYATGDNATVRAYRRRDARDRVQWPHRHSGTDRCTRASDPRRALLQSRIALGRRAISIQPLEEGSPQTVHLILRLSPRYDAHRSSG